MRNKLRLVTPKPEAEQGSYEESQTCRSADLLHFDSVVEELATGCLLVDARGVIRKANRSAREQLAIAHLRSTHPVLAAYVAPCQLSEVYQDLYHMSRAARPISKEVEFRRGDGVRFWARVEGRASTLFGEERLALLSMVDITGSRQIQGRLAASEARLRTLIQAMPDAIFVVRDGRIVYCNPAAARATGKKDECELLDTDFGGLVVGEIAPVMRALALQHDANREPLSIEIRLRGEREFIAATTWMPVVLDDSPAVLCVARDETERRALQARLGQEDRMSTVGVLAAGVAHEINNPLTYVTMSLGEILGESERLENPDARDAISLFAQQALDGTKRVGRIVQDLRSFARDDDETTLLDVNDVVARALELARPTIKHRAATRTNLGQVVPVMANDGRLTQIVLNLVMNAADAIAGTGQPGEVVVSTAATTHDVVISVLDCGPGIPPDTMSRIFEPFFTTKGVGEGSGLGLFICHKYVQEYGGVIEVQSTIGKGTCFTVRLPATEGEGIWAEPDDEQAENDHDERQRLLVIDDEPELRRIVAAALRYEFHVTTVGSVQEACELLQDRSAPFDFVLCDLLLPGMTGDELDRWVRHHRPDLADRVAFITGGACTATTKLFVAANEHRILPKPFSAGELISFIRRQDIGPDHSATA